MITVNAGLMVMSRDSFAFKEYRTPKCSRCHVIVKVDAEVCPNSHCRAIFMRDD